ncbi:DUF4249 domain-containing protein [Inquilinus sp. KBS0705]|nr:DUF4249 domain-containing protein [Inquilinus sp. KBS0705]
MTIRNIYPVTIATALCYIAVGCKKPYVPPVITAPSSYLVVDGVINSGADSTFIRLSLTKNLGDTTITNGVAGAALTVESQDIKYNLSEIKTGVYVHSGLNLDKTKKYRLRIKTVTHQEYLSDEVEVKQTPPIDSITFEPQSNALNINVSTHDPSNKTVYYRWDFDEDWRFHAKYSSGFEAAHDTLRLRTDDHQIYYCFNKDRSNHIALASSVKLAQDVISKGLVTTIPSYSDKISVRYTMLLRQYALTKEAYNFYENLQKNTETLGSIFDALPSEITGNIHSISNPKEPVIGFISASTVTSKRIFIDKAQLPANWVTAYPETCTQDSTIGFDAINTYILSKAMIATSGIYKQGFLIGVFRSTYECADCTVRGVVKPPPFWK